MFGGKVRKYFSSNIEYSASVTPTPNSTNPSLVPDGLYPQSELNTHLLPKCYFRCQSPKFRVSKLSLCTSQILKSKVLCMQKYKLSGQASLSIPVSASQIVCFIYSKGDNLALKEALDAVFPSLDILVPGLPFSRVKYFLVYLVQIMCL